MMFARDVVNIPGVLWDPCSRSQLLGFAAKYVFDHGSHGPERGCCVMSMGLRHVPMVLSWLACAHGAPSLA